MLSFEFLLRLSAILKLDFLKSPGKSGGARAPRGMKLGNRELARRPAIFRFDLQRNLLFKLTLFAPIQQIQICLVSKRTTPVRVLWSKENKFAVSQ